MERIQKISLAVLFLVGLSITISLKVVTVFFGSSHAGVYDIIPMLPSLSPIILLIIAFILHKFKRYALAIGLSILGIVVSIGITFVMFGASPKGLENTVSNIKKPLNDKDGTTISDNTNPMDLFWKEFSSKNYKVTISGVRKSDQAFYFEKGSLVRVGDPGSVPYFILKNQRLYAVDASKKTFKDLDATFGFGKTLTDTLGLVSIIESFTRESREKVFLWGYTKGNLNDTTVSDGKQIEGNGYLANQKWSSDDGRGGIVSVAVKIFLDPVTNLMTTMLTSRESTSQVWGATYFHYEVIGSMDEMKKFPAEYTKENVK